MTLDLQDYHSKCITNISMLLKELKTNNVHEQFYIFCYLLWEGFLSIDRKYVYNNVDVLDEENTIFLGKGCCRHNAILLAKVINEMNILHLTAQEIGVKTLEIHIDKIMPINRIVERNDNKRKTQSNEFNHSLTLTQDRKGVYLLDPTYLTVIEVLKNRNTACFNGVYNLDKQMLYYELSSHAPYNKYPSINLEFLINSFNIAQNICRENIGLIEDFYIDNYSNYENIKKLVLAKN